MAYDIKRQTVVDVINQWAPDIRYAVRHYGNINSDGAARYAMALIYLEARKTLMAPGGDIDSSRFEKHIYQRILSAVQNRKSFMSIPYEVLYKHTEDEFRLMATSWGLFQLMGYYWYHISKESVKYKDIDIHEFITTCTARPGGMVLLFEWALNVGYPKEFIAGEWDQCFHIHNTGRRYRKIKNKAYYSTYHPDYVPTGLKVMDMISDLEPIVSKQKLLKAAGLYKSKVDGIWGPKSEEAWSTYKANPEKFKDNILKELSVYEIKAALNSNALSV